MTEVFLSKDYTPKMTSNTDDYLRGQQDYIDGKPKKEGQSTWYNRGYDSEKSLEALR